MPQDLRLQQLTHWVQETWPEATLTVASADASFRRYFRIHHKGKTMIAMDAPPDKEESGSFIEVTHRLLNVSVHAPDILKQSLSKGFMVLSDLGSTPYLACLNDATADTLYTDAMKALISIQQADTNGLPPYDAHLLQQEMQLMPDWFLTTHLSLNLTSAQQHVLQVTFEQLTTVALEQPQVFVHRDYHSRNLMFMDRDNPGVIDYQDAVLGAITYDLVSLLRDCYISWSSNKVTQWALEYRDKAVAMGLMASVDDTTFMRWFDLMGLQRHIKVLGIFARLYHRDGKENYLNDLPQTLEYVMQVGKKHPETQALVQLFNDLNIPKII
ncbi:MAG: phosphotransferase [Cocleimonas sp.]|nr:phosphotransferase [Cocleimonas sp.]